MFNGQVRAKLHTSFIMLALALIALATATYAWFSLSQSTKVMEMSLNVTTGNWLKISTVYSNNIEDYHEEITNEMVNAQLKQVSGYSQGLTNVVIEPLTSGNVSNLYTEAANNSSSLSAEAIEGKKYLEVTLWFLGTQDMYVHLAGDSSKGSDGTKVISASTNTAAQAKVLDCVRVGFLPYAISGSHSSSSTASQYTVKGSYNIYEPVHNVSTTLNGRARTDAGGSTQNVFSSLDTTVNDTLFQVKANVPTKLVVKIWIEGEDSECTNDVRKAQFATRLRFQATDANGVPLS